MVALTTYLQVLERAYCLITMSDVNEAGWYKMHIKPNTPAVIVLRILSSLRLEPDSSLKVLALRNAEYVPRNMIGIIKLCFNRLVTKLLLSLTASTGPVNPSSY